ncbi:MAG: stage 0 sporulation family protein [Clostridia bacterium]|nr:stage 0 sporulation family protein [Clostridia bacterium]
MSKVVGVRFKEGGKLYYFDPLELEIKAGDGVIVDTSRGTVFGDVAEPPHYISDEQILTPLKPVIRVATPEDHEQRRIYKEKEKEAFAVCLRKIEDHGLVMKLVEVEYAFNGSKIMFYFTADGRVDFRELVKDLASVFKTRIELRQIGVRDEAKMLGGLGVCGRPICCSSFLTDFIPVSIKMAKEQNLSLNQTKISGICGRLMCCLKFEQAGYEAMHKIMPKTGKEVYTPDGLGTVLDNNVISETTSVKVQMPDGTFEVKTYPFRELKNKAGEYFGETEPECGERCAECKKDCPARTEKPIEDDVLAAEAEPEEAEEASIPGNEGDGSDGDAL